MKAKPTKNQGIILAILLTMLAIITFFNYRGDNSGKSSSATKPNSSLNNQVTQDNASKDNSELKADIKRAYDVPGIEVNNLEAVAWNECELEINNGYKRMVRNPLEPNSPLNNPYALFTKDDGTKFDPDTTVVKSVSINCKINGNTRFGYYTF